MIVIHPQPSSNRLQFACIGSVRPSMFKPSQYKVLFEADLVNRERKQQHWKINVAKLKGVCERSPKLLRGRSEMFISSAVLFSFVL